MESTTEGFELTGGQDGLAIRHVGRVVDNHDDGTLVGEDVGTSSDKLKLTDDVIGDTFEVNITGSILGSIESEDPEPVTDATPRDSTPITKEESTNQE